HLADDRAWSSFRPSVSSIDRNSRSPDDASMRLILLTLALSVFTAACPVVDGREGSSNSVASPDQSSYPSVSGHAVDVHLAVEQLRALRVLSSTASAHGLKLATTLDST